MHILGSLINWWIICKDELENVLNIDSLLRLYFFSILLTHVFMLIHATNGWGNVCVFSGRQTFETFFTKTLDISQSRLYFRTMASFDVSIVALCISSSNVFGGQRRVIYQCISVLTVHRVCLTQTWPYLVRKYIAITDLELLLRIRCYYICSTYAEVFICYPTFCTPPPVASLTTILLLHMLWV